MPQHPLQQIVSRIRRSWNRQVALELIAWSVAAILLLVFIAAGIDYAFRFIDRGLRWLLSATLLAGLAWIGWTMWQRWRQRRWSLLHTASAIQNAFPQLGDRLASSLEFLVQDESEGAEGSAALRRAVVLETTAAIERRPVNQVAKNSHFATALAIGTVVALLAGGLALWRPHDVQTAIARLAVPWNNVEWPRRHTLEFVDPPTLIARGQPFEVALVDTQGNLPDDTRIEYRYLIDGRRHTDIESMQRVGDTMVARRDKISRDFEFRAMGGDHRSMPWQQVEVIDPPTLSTIEIAVHPPAYSGLAPAPLAGHSRLLAGSSLAMTGTSASPLKAAWIEVDGGKSLPLELSSPTILELPAGRWQASLQEGTERLVDLTIHLTGENGLSGVLTTHRLRVVADPAPQVTWQEPGSDLHVLPTAVVPVTARVADNLAIATGELRIEVTGPLTADGAGPSESTPRAISLYELNSPPTLEQLPATGAHLDERQFQTELPLADYQLEPGSVVSLMVVATDFQPSEGRATAPRRLTIISSTELEARLAARQAEILRLLEQALGHQRTTREQSLDIIASRPPDTAAERLRIDQLARGRSQQQKVQAILTGPRDSVRQLVSALREQVEVNRLDRPELLSRLDSIVGAIQQLEQAPLPEAEQLLTDIRKELESVAGDTPPAHPSLAGSAERLEAAQVEIIETLQRLVEQVAEWSDADRFLRELARLEEAQRELAAATAAAAIRQAQARAQGGELPQEEVNRLVARQQEAARDVEKLLEAMRQMATDSALESDFAGRLADAVEQADRSQLTRNMASAARQADQGQLGRAANTQQSAAEQLAELLDLLRDRSPTDPEQLADELRKLQAELAQAQRVLEQAEGASDQERQDLANQLNRLARKLDRMTASAASQNTQQAATQTSPRPGESAQQQEQQRQAAQQNLADAQRQLAQRIAEVEQQQQQRLLERLAVVLEALIPVQQQLLEETLQWEDALNAADEPPQANIAEQLSKDQVTIADQLASAINDLAARAVFQLSLRGAEGDMRQAATSLQRGDPGRLTQQLELAALARLRHVLEVLREPPPTPDNAEENEGGEGNQGGQEEQEDQPPPIIELAEAKMLRWLQVELNSRTRLYEADLADNPQQRVEKQEVARRLAEEQRQLEELVREMLQRRESPERQLENL